MIGDHDEREKLFNAAADLKDPAQRAALLDAECGTDPQLRAEIEELLRHDDAAGSFLNGSVGSPETTDNFATASERIGERVGAYTLREQIGEGGFGLVFVAEQQEPVRRLVALKIIKPGMDTREVLARFTAERQALAMMDHPNIARVFDGGSTANGRPYFVMELVRGVPITDYCDQHQLSPRERLELFVSVCHAVQHAHQKGIIHRDIKPSNVLVTSHDGRPVTKVIDFGVAKAIGVRLTEHTVYTQFSQMIGTPLYMSPEQAALGGLDIDTRSDIYSLGVLLYELLTGTTPFDKKRVQTAAYDEIRRMIREEEPQKPSTRLSHSGDSLPSVAAQRKTEPAKLSRLVRGELDWITMKCLEKDRTRRYETANGLSVDVMRYLSDEPVAAGPPSTAYRLRKFARRHRAGLAMAAATLLLLVLLGGGTGWFMRDRSARHAETAGRIDSALQETARLRDQKNWSGARLATQRADALLAASVHHADLRLRFDVLVRDLDMVDHLERARETLLTPTDDFWNDAGADASIQTAFKAYGIDVTALSAGVAADRVRGSAIVDQLISALDDWAWVTRGNADRFELIRNVVCQVDPEPWRVRLRDPLVRRDRAALENLSERPDAALQPPMVIVYLGRALSLRGAHERAVEVLTAAARRHPEHFWLNYQLGSILRWTFDPPRFEEATAYFRAAVAIRPHAPGIYLGLGACFRRPGHEDEAIACLRRALELNPNYAHPYHSIGQALGMKGDWAGAIDSYKICLEKSNWPRLRATTHRDLGGAYAAINDWPNALANWRKCVEIEPNRVQVQTMIAWHLATAPDENHRDPIAAVAHAKKALEFGPTVPNHWSNLGVAYLKAGDIRSAVEHLEKADEKLSGGDHFHRFFLAMAYLQSGEKDKARRAYDQAVEWMEKNQPKNEEFLRFRADAEDLLKKNPGSGAVSAMATVRP